MKRKAVVFVIFLLFAAVFQAAAQGLPRLAVAEFSINDLRNQKLAGDAVTVRNLVESNMINTGKYRMITREEIDKLLREQSIQLSSIASLENLRKLRLQNISYLVTGSVDANGSDYVVTLRIPDVAAGRFYHSDYALMGGGSRDLLNGVTALVRSFIAGLSAGGERAAQQLGGGGRGEYKVGDFGPAGGLIFYDKGVFSDGWRYLEAAPVETEFRAQWGASGKTIDGTQANVGSGKRNTRIIVDKLNEWGESGRAAQLCDSLVSDGFSDWFLPGKDELDLMYKNLAKKGLGNFSSDDYWSSSEYSSGSAWDQRFSDGPQSGLNKTYTDSVRAVRAF